MNLNLAEEKDDLRADSTTITAALNFGICDGTDECQDRPHEPAQKRIEDGLRHAPIFRVDRVLSFTPGSRCVAHEVCNQANNGFDDITERRNVSAALLKGSRNPEPVKAAAPSGAAEVVLGLKYEKRPRRSSELRLLLRWLRRDDSSMKTDRSRTHRCELCRRLGG